MLHFSSNRKDFNHSGLSFVDRLLDPRVRISFIRLSDKEKQINILERHQLPPDSVDFLDTLRTMQGGTQNIYNAASRIKCTVHIRIDL